MYPKIPLAQSVIEIFKQHHIQDIVISPGSRNAPLTIGFANQPFFNCYSIADERCAAFFAMGIAQQKQQPVALVCTSGSALLNYYPAIAEAFYSNIPLLVVSADRPLYKIDIGDGQTIQQKGVFKNHILFEANLTEETSVDNDKRINKAILYAKQKKGPTHINIPFEEPLYETVSQPTVNPVIINAINQNNTPFILDVNDTTLWENASKKLILVGELFPNSLSESTINFLAKNKSCVVLTEKTSNLHHSSFIDTIDVLIASFSEEEKMNFKPDLLVTFGGMVVSKKIKELLRKYQPENHWHISNHNAYNTYFCLTKHFKTSAETFFKTLKEKVTASTADNYQENITTYKKQRLKAHKNYIKTIPFSDLKAYEIITENLPKNCLLQVGNSSAIRYLQLFPLSKTMPVFCNRGTSGIDGSTSTAIGAAITTDTISVLITGDVSFFYDSNALWNNYIPSNFKIILINNGGGGIFRILPGHKNNQVFSTYFETSHQLTAAHLSKMYNFSYETAKTSEELKDKLVKITHNNTQPQLLEIFTPQKENDFILKNYFKSMIM